MTIEQLKQHRLKLGLSQRKFCAKMGIKLKSYQNWEQGRYPIPELLVSLIKKSPH